MKNDNIEHGFKQVACELLDISTRSYSNFSKQNRPIIKLLEKYFLKDELEEFLKTGKIKSQEKNAGYKFISFHYLNIFRMYLEEFIKPGIPIDCNHPLFIFFKSIDFISLDSKHKYFSDEEYVSFIEKIYADFIVVQNIEPLYIKKLLNVDVMILSQLFNSNISIEELLKDSKLKVYYIFYKTLVSFKEYNLSNYIVENNLTLKDIKIDETINIENQNIDFFIMSFNEAYLNINEFKNKYTDKDLDKNRLEIVNMIISSLDKL
ncbi:hypothetical protein [Malaciobacter pacificus]|nr:hypothetical protein [Malaciobacter pacificus]